MRKECARRGTEFVEHASLIKSCSFRRSPSPPSNFGLSIKIGFVKIVAKNKQVDSKLFKREVFLNKYNKSPR